jgi:hypothetical protein
MIVIDEEEIVEVSSDFLCTVKSGHLRRVIFTDKEGSMATENLAHARTSR